MAWTLVDLSKIETDTLRKSVLDTLLYESDIMQLIPWETIGALATTIVRYASLPSIGFRKVNEGYSSTDARLEQAVENIALMGCYMDCDKAIARAKNTIADARAISQTMALKGVAYQFNDKFINGNPESDPEEFKGIQKRVTDLNSEGFTDQYVNFESANAGRGILYDTTERHYFLNRLDVLMYAIKGHKPDFLIMNSDVLLAMRAILRQERLLDTSRDMFDRVVDSYMGARMIDIGVKADQSTEIITSTETVGANDDESSIYAVKFGVGQYLWGIQEYPLEVTDKGLLEDTPVYRTELDWPLGLACADPYSIARGYCVIPTNLSS